MLLRIVRQILNSVRKRGYVGTMKFAKRELTRKYRQYRSLDRIHGTDTGGYIPLESLNIASENRHHGVQYQPTPTKLFNRVFKSLAIRHEDYVFIDFGSGKGRALLLASNYPFKKVIGVEFSPELHVTALRNISQYRSRHQRCFQIEALCMDAMDYEVPLEPAIYYFYNPFDAEIMRAVLLKIRKSLERHPRDAFFIYCNPLHANLFGELGFERNSVVLVQVEQGVDGAWANL